MSARIVSLRADANGVPYLALGSPHAYGDARRRLYEALRPDLSVLRIEPAPRVNRRIPPDEPSPHPETCTPYQDATGLGFVLRPRLPLLFVRTRRGELLPDARTALAYARENEADFADVLREIEEHAAAILDPAVVRRYGAEPLPVLRDLVQPYRTFGPGFLTIPAGLYIVTEPGTGTIIGPPVNGVPPLPVQTGLIETDWHHHALFVVSAYPHFAGRSLLIRPRETIAQFYIVAYRATAAARVEHSTDNHGGQPAYEALLNEVIEQLSEEGKGVIATQTGVASVTLDCLHCRVSVTRAAEEELPHDHIHQMEFIRPYKRLQRHYRRKSHE